MRRPLLVTHALTLALLAILGGVGLLGSATAERPPRPGGAGRPVPTWAAPLPARSPAPTASPTASPAASPTPEDVPPAPRPAAPGRARLVAELHAILDDPAHAVPGPLGVAVLDGQGRPVLEVDADTPLLPASTQKLVTAAAAIEELGPAFRFTTTARAARPVGRGGVLPGDLVLVGTGDPALATPRFGEYIYPARPRTPLEDLADRLVAGGLRSVTGRVVGDPRAFPGRTTATGWPSRYLHALDARHVAGLTVDGGLDVTYEAEEPDGPEDLVVELAADPAAEAAEALRDLLVQRGVTVAGDATSAPRGPAPVVLAEVDSAPLSRLLGHTLRRSDNHMADHLFRRTGQAAAGAASWSGAARGARRALEHLDLDWSGAVLADGSGLSRDDRLTARFLASLDQAMWAGDRSATWRRLQAVVGESGTLRRRLIGSGAAGRFRGKTGTLDDVRALVGAAVGPDGARYHLAVLANGLDTPTARANARALTDALVVRLVEDLHPEPAPIR